MNFIERVINSIECRLNQPRISLFKTLYFNFRILPIKTAIHLPIYIYTGIRFWSLLGKIEFSCPLERGLVKIGKNIDSFQVPCRQGFIFLSEKSKIVFGGKTLIGVNCTIRVCSDGLLYLGAYSFLGSGVKIVCNGGCISIGQYTRIAFDTLIMNSGFHYIYNQSKNSISRRVKPIEIGAYNWIGNRSSISGGCKTKEFTIICSNSVVSKDFTMHVEENQMLGGIPTKIIATNVRRIFSPKCDQDIDTFFNTHPDANIFYPHNAFLDKISDIEADF